jgi:hypothetical protein
LDTADTSGVLDGSDSDVTLFTPSGGPGVSDDVVVLTSGIIGTPSNGGDGVIELGSALSRVDDTSGVVVEDFLISLDSYGDNTLLNGTLEASGRVFRDISVVLDGDITSGKGSLAGRLATSLGAGIIGVGGLESLTIFLQILEGLVLPSTIAAIAFGVAGDQLLLGKAQKSASGSEVSVLGSSGGREGPA